MVFKDKYSCLNSVKLLGNNSILAKPYSAQKYFLIFGFQTVFYFFIATVSNQSLGGSKVSVEGEIRTYAESIVVNAV